ncbi:MAG TPA: TetR/AcrR family transcriptional regulator [Gaiellales bacterium]|nr:TetR/AcrR family transcriptional regulator [Gaiellales bacterium]
MSPADRARTPWGTISRDRIVDAAAQVVATEGSERLSIRRLASDLGVAPMSLYRHVRGKDEVLEAVVDRLLAETWEPAARHEDWRAWITDAAERLRSLLISQPAALHVYLRHPVVSPAAVARMTAMMEVLRSGMGSEDAARRAYAAIHTYTLGFSALEAARAGGDAAAGNAGDLAHELAAFTSGRQFSEGLGYLLDGISNDANRETTR